MDIVLLLLNEIYFAYSMVADDHTTDGSFSDYPCMCILRVVKSMGLPEAKEVQILRKVVNAQNKPKLIREARTHGTFGAENIIALLEAAKLKWTANAR